MPDEAGVRCSYLGGDAWHPPLLESAHRLHDSLVQFSGVAQASPSCITFQVFTMHPTRPSQHTSSLPSGLLALAALLAVLIACDETGSNATDACFLFPEGDRQGFSFDGIYDGGSATQIAVSGCDASTIGLNMGATPNWASSATDSTRALWVGMTGTCFPRSAPNTGFVRFGFVSPDLASNTDWQDLDGFRFQARSNIRGVRVQPLARVRMLDGTETYIASRNFPSVPQTTSTSAPWTEASLAFSDSVQTVLHVEARVFVDPDSSFTYPSPESAVWIDGVCPTSPEASE